MKIQLLFLLIGSIIIHFMMTGCAGKHKLSGVRAPQTTEEWVHHLFDTSAVYSGLYMVEAGEDLTNHEPVIDYNSSSLFTPASNTKILTFYSALKFLSPRLEGIKWRKHDSTTYFKGTGDPGFLDPRFDSYDVFEFLEKQNELVYLSDWSSDDRWGSGWSWDDYPYYYSAQRSPFPIYGNVVRARCEDRQWLLEPEGFIQNKVFDPDALSLKRNELSNIFQVNLASCPDHTLHIPFVWTPEVFAGLLSDTLHRSVQWNRSLPAFRHVNSLPSIPSPVWKTVPGSGRDTLLRAMMYDSDNLIAEQMLWNISSSLWDSISTSRVIDSLMNTDLLPWKGQIRWVDGSGLSIYNKFSPRFLVALLENLYKLMPKDQLFQYFAAGGVRGTITAWYGNKNSPYIFAKTGTLSGVHCLSGYLVADSGKTYAFSFMHNNFLGSSNQYKVKMEQVLRWVKENY